MSMADYASKLAPSARCVEDNPSLLVGDASEQTLSFYFAQNMRGHRPWTRAVPQCAERCAANATDRRSAEFVSCADACWRGGEAALVQVRRWRAGSPAAPRFGCRQCMCMCTGRLAVCGERPCRCLTQPKQCCELRAACLPCIVRRSHASPSRPSLWPALPRGQQSQQLGLGSRPDALTTPLIMRGVYGSGALPKLVVMLREPSERLHSAFWQYGQYRNK